MATLSTFTRWVDGQQLVHSDTDGWWIETDGILNVINDVKLESSGMHSSLIQMGLQQKVFTISILPGDNEISKTLDIARYFTARSRYTLSSSLILPPSSGGSVDNLDFIVTSVEFEGLNNSPVSITCTATTSDLIKSNTVVINTQNVTAGNTPSTVSASSLSLGAGAYELVLRLQNMSPGAATFNTSTECNMTITGSISRSVAFKFGIPDIISGNRPLATNLQQITSLRPVEPGVLLLPQDTTGLFSVRSGDNISVSWDGPISSSDITITTSLVRYDRFDTPGDWAGGGS